MSSLASRLKHRITVYRPPDPEKDVDEAGQPNGNWIPVDTLWAEITPLSGRQLESAKQLHAEITTRIAVRFRKDIDHTMKAVCGNEEFEFLYILHKNYGKKELHIMCKEMQ